MPMNLELHRSDESVWDRADRRTHWDGERWLLAMMAQDVGFPVAAGGSSEFSGALVRRAERIETQLLAARRELDDGERVALILRRDEARRSHPEQDDRRGNEKLSHRFVFARFDLNKL